MRINLTAQRRARLLQISSPGKWMSLGELVARYNQRYEVASLTATVPKLKMHEDRLKRVLDSLVAEGCYEFDTTRGYRFMTAHPTR